MLWAWHLTEPQRLRAAAILTHAGRPVASLSDLSGPVYPPGAPEHIAWYLAVDDVETRTGTALDAGAQLVVEPFELPGLGAMSTVIDPFGAAVSLWEQRGFTGWTHDPAAQDFYRLVGLDDPEASFIDGDDNAWVPQINGLVSTLQTPGGTRLRGT